MSVPEKVPVLSVSSESLDSLFAALVFSKCNPTGLPHQLETPLCEVGLPHGAGHKLGGKWQNSWLLHKGFNWRRLLYSLLSKLSHFRDSAEKSMEYVGIYSTVIFYQQLPCCLYFLDSKKINHASSLFLTASDSKTNSHLSLHFFLFSDLLADSSGVSHPFFHKLGLSGYLQDHTHLDVCAVHAEMSSFSFCLFERQNFSEANICKQQTCFQRRERFQGQNIKIDHSRWKGGMKIHVGLTKA